MSTLGKVLTVLVALVAVGLAVLVPTELVLRKNWRARYEREHSQFQDALRQRDKAIQQRDEEKGQWDAHRAHLQQQIETLENELNLRKRTITTLTEEKENQETRLQELAEQLKGLQTSLAKEVAQRDQWRNERDTAMKAKDELEVMYEQLDAKYQKALADKADAEENVRQTRERLADAEKLIAYYEEQPGVKRPTEVPVGVTVPIRGLVKSADNEARVAEISLGSDDGVVKGMTFYVYNRAQSRYLATLKITKVSKNSAAGTLSVIRGDVKVNDHVTNRFEW